MKSSKLSPLFLLLLLVAGCGGGGGTSGPKALVSIAVSPANPSMPVAARQQFTATGTYSDNTTEDLTAQVSWSSSYTAVATISSAGLATAVAVGSTTVKASLGSVSGATALTVSPDSTASNVLPVTVSRSLGSAPNTALVSVTVCATGTTTCLTIDNILLDTGSYGLRIFKSALNGILPAATSGVAECVQYADNSADWGPVQTADVYLGGEPKVTVPIQVIDANFASGMIPAACSYPKVSSLDQSPSQAGYNGILGIGFFAQDCGIGCEDSAKSAKIGMYFSCSGAGCSSTAVSLANQVQNPVPLLPQDNNGILVQLPGVASGGTPSVTGALVLGIGTRSNNAPAGATAYPADPNPADQYYGYFTTTFGGASYPASFIDSGSNGLFFSDSALAVCGSWYCPPATTTLPATNAGYSGSPSGSLSFPIGNATALFNSGNSVFSELGGPSVASGFDWGVPFFLGRSVFVGIAGKASSLGTGPYWAY